MTSFDKNNFQTDKSVNISSLNNLRKVAYSQDNVGFDSKNLTVNFGANLNKIFNNDKNIESLTIDNMPPDCHLRFWADDKGYFVWFQNSQIENQKFYIPDSLHSITVNNQKLIVEAQKLNVNMSIMNQDSGFGNFTKTTSALNYFSKMSSLSQKALTIEQKTLQQSAQNSNNPYFKIYLADVDCALALKPIINQVLSTGTAQLNNPYTIGQLNNAISMLQLAQQDSINALTPYNQIPPSNVTLPLDPFGGYNTYPGSMGYYGYWGGSLDQARAREAALVMIRNLIELNTLPPIELPPNLPSN